MTKVLTAIRHAKSSWDDPGLADRDRPLSKRGRKAAPAIARYLQKLGHLPDAMLSSPAVRAADTATLMAEQFGFLKQDIRIDDRLYFAGLEGIAEAIRETPDDIQRLFFFSHEPVISSFCERYCRLGNVHFATSGVCAMEFETDQWSVLPERGKKLFFVIPKAIDPAL